MAGPNRLTDHSALPTSAAYGAVHAMVDAASVAVLMRQADVASLSAETTWTLYLLYNVLAFGLQFSLGAVADRLQAYRAMATLGIVLVCLAIIASGDGPYLAVGLGAVGNAAFHVGAGALVLRRSPDRAAAAGLFVAPGALGLALGVFYGASVLSSGGVVVAALVGLLAASLLLFIRRGENCRGYARQSVELRRQPRSGDRSYKDKRDLPNLRPKVALAAVGALLLAVALRSTVGQTIVGAWREQGTQAMLVALTMAVLLGKAGGGFLADRFGWLRTSVVGLVSAAMLLGFFADRAPAVLLGAMLFQVTMPVTLLAVYRVFPNEPGLAFGLPSFALLVGVVPILVWPHPTFTQGHSLLLLVVASVVAVLIGLLPIVRAQRPHDEDSR